MVPDYNERMAEIQSDPERLAYFLAIREQIGEGHDQLVDDMFSTPDGTLLAVSRPSFADVVGIDLRTRKIVWRFPMHGQRADHMAVNPAGTRLLADILPGPGSSGPRELHVEGSILVFSAADGWWGRSSRSIPSTRLSSRHTPDGASVRVSVSSARSRPVR